MSSRRESSHECRCGPTTESPANRTRDARERPAVRCPGLYALGRGTERDTRSTPHAVLAPRSTARPRPPRRPDAGACVRARRAAAAVGRYIVQSSSPIVFAYSWCVYTCNRSLPQPVHLAGTYAHTKRHNSHVHHRDPYVRTIRDPHDIARRTHREWPWGACAHTCSRAHTCVHALGRPPRSTQPRTECSSSLAQRGKERGALQRPPSVGVRPRRASVTPRHPSRPPNP